ncbi:MAG: energy transducer TonB family protein [Steroidobacteraceae bacterium]
MSSRALALREGAAPVRDRLVMTIFLAAVLHGIVILGITFGSGAPAKDPAPGLEVLLVSDEVPAAARNDSAAYLAQRTQLGSGNTDRSVPLRNRASSGALAAHKGFEDGVSFTAKSGASGEDEERVLTSTSPQPDILYVGAADAGTAGERPIAIAGSDGEPGPDEDTGAVELRGPHRDDLWVTPDSRESTLAPYLDHWRRRVERIGTLNYPIAARQAGPRASPVLEVQIGANGRLESAQVRRSSGDAELDHAALEILKLASPFDAFPPELARKYHALRFAYEWQFVGGRIASGAVSTAP